MPPSHWRIALQTRIAFGAEFKSMMIVEPVVVMPDMLSKKESVMLKFRSEKINGSDPNIATLIQDKEVNKKVSGTKLFTDVFKDVTEVGKKLLNQDNDSGERTFINAMMKFIKTKMTGGDEDFLMVEIKAGEFTTHDFQILVDNLDKFDLDIALRTYKRS